VRSTSNITAQRITGNIGAIIGGDDLRNSPPTDAVAVLRQALLDHGVIFFRSQDITLDQYWAFMENFGQPQKEEPTGTDHDRPGDGHIGGALNTGATTQEVAEVVVQMPLNAGILAALNALGTAKAVFDGQIV
jgi:alpha-ketoglutarate-dependent taurine dioxygenase